MDALFDPNLGDLHRLPGLFHRWEMASVLEPGLDVAPTAPTPLTSGRRYALGGLCLEEPDHAFRRGVVVRNADATARRLNPSFSQRSVYLMEAH